MNSDSKERTMETKKIYEIKPFDRFALGTCMEYGYIPGYTYFGGTEFEYFLNKWTYFHYMDSAFCISTADQIDFENLTASHGIEVTLVKEYEENIISKILKCLDEGSLIMLRVKGAESYEVNTGHITEKSLSEHWLLCFGYDLEAREFDILEHRTNVAATYKHCRIAFDNYAEAYRALNKDAEDSTLNQIIMCKVADVYEEIDYRSEYLKMRASNLERFELSNRCLKDMMDKLKVETEQEKEFENDYVLIFTEIIKYCQRELWLLEEAGMPFDSTELIKQLNIVRTAVMKCNLYPSAYVYSKLAEHIMLAEEQFSRFNRHITNILKGAVVIEMA